MSLRAQLFEKAGEAMPDHVVAADAGTASNACHPGNNGGQPPGVGTHAAANAAYQQLKLDIHAAIIERVELEKLQRLTPDQVRREIAVLVERIIEERNIPINEAERRRLVSDVRDEMLGYGPLEPLLSDPTISDILVNTASKVYVERRGKLELTDVTFHDDAHLMKVIRSEER